MNDDDKATWLAIIIVAGASTLAGVLLAFAAVWWGNWWLL